MESDKDVPADRISALLFVFYKLGGWGVLAVVASLALKYIWDERTQVNKEFIAELRDGKAATVKIIEQNTTALRATSAAQEDVAKALKELTDNRRP